MKNQMSRLGLVLAGVAVAVAISAISYALDADLRAVQSGEAALVCVMKDGERTIDGSKVTGRVDGKWTFDGGGYAGNCRIVKGGEL